MGLLRHGDDTPGGRRFQMREKLASIGDDAWIEDDRGERVFKVDGKALRLRDRYTIDVEGGHDLKAHGNIVDHEYEIERDGDVVATISKKWFRVRDTYGIEVRPGEDEPLMLALTVAIDEMSER